MPCYCKGVNGYDKNTLTGEIDQLDRLLINELEIDSRQSASDIARKIGGTTPATIHRRINRLFEARITTPTVIINHRAVGFETRAFIGLNVQPGTTDAVAKELQPLWNVQVVSLTAGLFDMLILTIFHNPQEMAKFVNQELGKIPELTNIEEITIMTVVRSFFKSKMQMIDTEKDEELVPRDLDDLELRLIKELEIDPRKTITNPGRKLGISRKVVARKLTTLKSDRILDVVSLVNPEVLGYGTQATILLKVHPSQIGAVADVLVGNERVRHILMVSGQFKLLFSLLFHDINELHRFVRTDLGRIPGITGCEGIINLSHYKMSSYLG